SRNDYNTGIISYGMVNMKLATRDEKGELQPALATKWSTDDAKLWKFEMRDDVFWHDGVKVTPEDVKFSIDYIKTQTANGASQLNLVESVTVTGESSFEVQLSAPNSRIIDSFISVIPKHVFEKVDNYEEYMGEDALLGNGPYRIAKHDTQNGVVELEAVDSYYRGIPNIKKIVFTTYKTADTMYMALENGEIDMIFNYSKGIDNSIIDTFKTNESITLKTVQNTGLPAAIYLNVKSKPISRPEIREAMRAAIDYDKMVELFGTEYATAPAAGVLPEGSFGYKDCGRLKRDLAKSKELLENIGCVDSDGDGIYELNGKKLEIAITASTAKEQLLRVAEIVKSNLEEAGIAVAINSVDATTYSTIADKDHSHVALMGGATPAGMNTSAGAGTAYYDARYYGWSMVENPEFQGLVDAMLAAKSDEEYSKLVGQVQDYYTANIPIIPLYNDVFVLAYSSKLDNFTYDFNYGLLNANTAYSLTKVA
ncbi:MAG: ABC transporter substrate-binding protein, partial [Oscillospiraceae bacterium]